ncbi:hypothetical protein M3J09_004806 [Ascochyta lentis]
MEANHLLSVALLICDHYFCQIPQHDCDLSEAECEKIPMLGPYPIRHRILLTSNFFQTVEVTPHHVCFRPTDSDGRCTASGSKVS